VSHVACLMTCFFGHWFRPSFFSCNRSNLYSTWGLGEKNMHKIEEELATVILGLMLNELSRHYRGL
jgi:hypothetical protein